MNLLVISASLSPNSRCRVLATIAVEEARRLQGVSPLLLDLRGTEMQFCDGRSLAEYDAGTRQIVEAVAAADGIILSFPVYNYTFNAAVKNVVELAGEAFAGKRVGLMSTAGGASSYMAPQTLAQCLTLDFQSTVIPRYVYATGANFNGEVLTDGGVRERIVRLVHAVAEPVPPPIV